MIVMKYEGGKNEKEIVEEELRELAEDQAEGDSGAAQLLGMTLNVDRPVTRSYLKSKLPFFPFLTHFL